MIRLAVERTVLCTSRGRKERRFVNGNVSFFQNISRLFRTSVRVKCIRHVSYVFASKYRIMSGDIIAAPFSICETANGRCPPGGYGRKDSSD